MNLPNALTTLRLVLVPMFGYLLLADQGTSWWGRVWAAVVFLVASLTDIIDGHIARSRDQVTAFGTIADPIADKVLTGVALIGLSVLGEVPWWISIVLLARELGVTALRFWVIRSGVIPASRGGKAKTLALTVAITLYVLPLGGAWGWVRAAVLGVAIVLSLATGADYVVRALRQRVGTDPGASTLVRALRESGHTVAVAESLTGGLLGAALSSVPGASAVFRGGVIAYATDVKASVLGVDAALLAAGGAVQPDVAAAMAEGVRTALSATYGLTTTGVAGPDPQDGQAVGTVFIALSGPSGTRCEALALHGGRHEIRSGTVRRAIRMLQDDLARVDQTRTAESG